MDLDTWYGLYVRPILEGWALLLQAKKRKLVDLYWGTHNVEGTPFQESLKGWESSGVKVNHIYSTDGLGYVQDVFQQVSISQGQFSTKIIFNKKFSERKKAVFRLHFLSNTIQGNSLDWIVDPLEELWKQCLLLEAKKGESTAGLEFVIWRSSCRWRNLRPRVVPEIQSCRIEPHLRVCPEAATSVTSRCKFWEWQQNFWPRFEEWNSSKASVIRNISSLE